MLTGKIKFFEEARNFGMIQQNEEGPDVFFHRSDLEDIPVPKPGLWVVVAVVPGYRYKNGTLRAEKVSLCGPKRVRSEAEHEHSRERENARKQAEVIPMHGTD